MPVPCAVINPMAEMEDAYALVVMDVALEQEVSAGLTVELFVQYTC